MELLSAVTMNYILQLLRNTIQLFQELKEQQDMLSKLLGKRTNWSTNKLFDILFTMIKVSTNSEFIAIIADAKTLRIVSA